WARGHLPQPAFPRREGDAGGEQRERAGGGGHAGHLRRCGPRVLRRRPAAVSPARRRGRVEEGLRLVRAASSVARSRRSSPTGCRRRGGLQQWRGGRGMARRCGGAFGMAGLTVIATLLGPTGRAPAAECSAPRAVVTTPVGIRFCADPAFDAVVA